MKEQPIENETELTDEELVRRAQQQDERLGPLGGYISIGQAFELHAQIAEELRVPAYKTADLFHRALRRYELTAVVQGFSDAVYAEASRVGTTAGDAWAKLGMPEEILEKSEMTSEKGVRTLFKLKADQRRKLDRARKAKKARQGKNSEKMSRKNETAKAEKSKLKRKPASQERKPTGKKRKAAQRL